MITTQEIADKLNSLVGKTFNYKGKNITIEKFKVLSTGNTVVFTPNPMNFLNNEIPDFLDNLFEPTHKEATEAQILVPNKELAVFDPTKENTVIKSALMDTLKKVSESAEYLPQAKAICDVVGVMVDVQKNEILMLGMINKYKK